MRDEQGIARKKETEHLRHSCEYRFCLYKKNLPSVSVMVCSLLISLCGIAFVIPAMLCRNNFPYYFP